MHTRWLPVWLLVTACGARVADATDEIESSDVESSEVESSDVGSSVVESGDGGGSGSDATSDGEPEPDLPTPELACETFGLTVPAHVISDELEPDKYTGGIVVGGDGLLAVWRNSWFPAHNLMARRLDLDGQPVGASFLLSQHYVDAKPMIRASTGGNSLLTQCVYFDGLSHVTALRVDAAGNVAQDIVSIAPAYCGTLDPQGIWTGMRHLIAWADASTDQLSLTVTDEQLGDRSTTLLMPEGNESAPRFAVAPDGTVALASGLEGGSIAIWLVSPAGALLGAPIEVELGFELGFPAALAITPLESGFIIWSSGPAEGGFYRIELDASGEPVAEPLAMPGWEAWDINDVDVAPVPGGHMLATSVRDLQHDFIAFALVDDAGVAGPPQEFDDGLDDGFIATPRLNHLDGRVFMTYYAIFELFGEEGEIRMAEFGCLD